MGKSEEPIEVTVTGEYYQSSLDLKDLLIFSNDDLDYIAKLISKRINELGTWGNISGYVKEWNRLLELSSKIETIRSLGRMESVDDNIALELGE